MKKLIHEIHRRSLWQVMGIYLGGSWVALQAVDVLANNFGLPPWFPGLALGLLVIGLPITLATAFVQERVVAPLVAGEADDPAADPRASVAASRPTHHRLLTWRNAILGGVGAALLWAGVAVGWLMFGRPAAGGAAEEVAGVALRSIAVLPFSTFSSAEQDKYFAEGIHDDLLTQLAKLDSLTVISRTSVIQYANTTKGIPQIAKELGVATVLEGGVQHSGDRIRMNVQLIEAATDRHLWAETYDEQLTAANLFAIQSDLARKIAAALQAKLTPEVAQRLDTRPTENLSAYDVYVRARYAMQTRGSLGEGLAEIRGLFEQAIAADSGYAAAWTGLADSYLAAWNWNQLPAEQARPKAESALGRALALDPDLAEAYVSRARLLGLQGKQREAEQAALRAIELNPGSADAHGGYGRILQGLGRYEESIRESRRAVELDPVNTGPRDLLADRLYFGGHYDESIEESRKVLEMAPDSWYAWYNIGWSQAVAGRAAEAVAAFRKSLTLTTENRGTAHAGLAYAFARLGQRDSSLVHLKSAEAGETNYDAVTVHFELGDADLAFSKLETALKADASVLRRLEADPSTERLRADPRYEPLVRKLGLR